MHCWPDSGILCILMHSDRLQLPCNDMRLGELEVNGTGRPGGIHDRPSSLISLDCLFVCNHTSPVMWKDALGIFEPPGNLPGPKTQPQALPHH